MAKEFEKFSAEFKKLQNTYGGYGDKERSGVLQRYRLANSNCSEGEANLRSALTTARKNGVTGDKFEDFMKDKTFQEGVKLLNVAANDLEETVAEVDAFQEKAIEGYGKATTLYQSITKDLAKRKDDSESKKDIISLQKSLEEFGKELKESTKASEKVAPYYRNYGKNFQKTVAGIIKEAPDVATKQTEDIELPAKLVDRVIKRNFSRCVAAAKDIKTLCDGAFSKAENNDKPGALIDIKQAVELRKEITPIAEEYQTIQKRYKDDIEVSKDKAKIYDMIEKMSQLDTNTERMIRGLATTLKKAG